MPGLELNAPPETEYHGRIWPVVAMLITGVSLLAFYRYSQTKPIPFGYFSHPPLYGIWEPTLDPLALTVVPATLALAAIVWITTSSHRLSTWLALMLLIAAGLVTAGTISLVRGEPEHLVRPLSTAPGSTYYTADLVFVEELGVRSYVQQHPALVDRYMSYNSKTHPPGVLTFLHVVFRVLGATHTLRIATALAALALCAAIAAWSMGRALGGSRAGLIAAALFVSAPGPLMLAYTNLDVVFATVMATAAALFLTAIHKQSPAWAAGGGAVLAIATLMTYATAFVGLAASVAIAVQVPSSRKKVHLFGAAATGGLVVLTLAWATLRFDIWASYRALPRVPDGWAAYDPYWIVASPTAMLIFAGVPLAALGVVGLVHRVPGARRPVLLLVLVAIMLVWASLPPTWQSLRPGEVERTWAFLYPMLAAAAGPVIDRWTQSAGSWRGPIVGSLVIVSVGQTVLVQSLWDNVF